VHQGGDEALSATAVAAHLLRSVFYTVRSVIGARAISIWERVLLPGRAVTDPLLGAVTVRGAVAPANRPNRLLALFVLTRRSARLGCVDE
jgi:hypothetical protein